MKFERKEQNMIIYFEGRIDSANAPIVEKEIDEGLSGYSGALILDAEHLTYISSTGLRIILKLRKQYTNLRVVNVSRDIYEIFEMTGFTEIIDIEKAYRTFDVTGAELIGEGANGKVYRITNDLIIKVYKSATSLEDIKRERELSRTAFVLGIPTAIPFDVVKVGDTYGSVFEMINAKSLAELLRDDPSKVDYVAEKTVSLAKTLHTTEVPDNIAPQSETTRSWLREAQAVFDEEHFAKLKSLIEAIPETGTMLHGDLHIKNIMQQGDDALLIDMDTLCSGHPIYELAFIYNAYEGFGICDRGIIRNFLKVDEAVAADLLHRILALYLGTEDEAKIADVKEKASVIGLLRVLRRIMRIGEQDTPAGKELLYACRDRINLAVEHLDTLTF